MEGNVSVFRKEAPHVIIKDNVPIELRCPTVKMVKVSKAEEGKVRFSLGHNICPDVCDTCIDSPATFCDSVISQSFVVAKSDLQFKEKKKRATTRKRNSDGKILS